MKTSLLTPVQRSALLRLLFGILALVAAGVVVLTRGMENYLHDATARRFIALIALLGIAFWIVDSILRRERKYIMLCGHAVIRPL